MRNRLLAITIFAVLIISFCFVGDSQAGEMVLQWYADYTYDFSSGMWAVGDHSYYFEGEGNYPSPWTAGTPEDVFTISEEAQMYPGNVLLKLWYELAFVPEPGNLHCERIELINPNQSTRAHISLVSDEMTFTEVKKFFRNSAVRMVWDNGNSVTLEQQRIFPHYPDSDDWQRLREMQRCSWTMR